MGKGDKTSRHQQRKITQFPVKTSEANTAGSLPSGQWICSRAGRPGRAKGHRQERPQGDTWPGCLTPSTGHKDPSSSKDSGNREVPSTSNHHAACCRLRCVHCTGHALSPLTAGALAPTLWGCSPATTQQRLCSAGAHGGSHFLGRKPISHSHICTHTHTLVHSR